MTVLKSDLIRTLSERGFIHQATDLTALDAAAAKGPITGYIGFDATASSLHVGSLVQIMLLRWMQTFGHRPIVLMGGGTTKVGDPSGKDTQRSMLSDADIAANIAGIKKAFTPFLNFGDTGAVMLNNAAWLEALGYVAFLRDFGVHFTINRMLTFDSVRLRLVREQPLTFLEFNYMLMQAVDFLELNRREGCRLQLGGSDQWGNIINGVELCRRVDGAEVFGLTSPLITTASGAKMGKTAQGAVWLNAELLSPYDYWQFWRNTEDADVGKFLKMFTELPVDEIARLEVLQGAEINDAKKVLANAATALLHGQDAAQSAAATAKTAFEEGALAHDLPRVALHPSAAVLEALIKAGFCASKGEARRLAKGGGVRIDDQPVIDVDQPLSGFARDGALIKLSAGKKKIVQVETLPSA